MKRILLLSVLAACVCAPASASDAGLKATIAKCKKAVVIVVGYDEYGKQESQGTGFFVTPGGLVATNVHVIEDSKSAGIRIIDERTAEEKDIPLKRIISSDEDADLVIFSVENPPAARDYLPISRNTLETGDNVYVIGNPMGLEQTVSNGIVSGIRKQKEFGFMYQITAPISSGSSGSPVMDSTGSVIGVATSQYKEGQNLNFVMPSGKLLPLMGRNANITFQAWKDRGYSVLPSSYYGLVNLGWRLEDMQKYKEAASIAGSVIKKNPKYSNAYILMARCMLELDRRDDALKYIKYGLATDPKKEYLHNDMGIIYADMDMDDMAAREYYAEMKNFPKNYVTYYNLASLYYRNDMMEDAMRIIELGVKKADYTSGLLQKAGDLLMENADYSMALQKYRQAVKLDRTNSDAILGLGRALLENDDKQGATDCYYALQKISTKKAERLYLLIQQ